MANRFIVPDSSPGGPEDSPAPSTPDRRSQRGAFSFSYLGNDPSTTPAGPPPPSSAASFTPAGAPSDSYLGSSIMRGVTAQKPPQQSAHSRGGTGRRLFGSNGKAASNASLGRSIRGKQRQPSGLSRGFSAVNYDDEDDDQAEEDVEDEVQPRGSLFRMSATPKRSTNIQNSTDDVEAEIEQYIEDQMAMEEEDDQVDDESEEEDAEGEEDGEFMEDAEGEEASEDGDLFLNMRHDDRGYEEPIIGEEPDLMLNNPTATDRMMKEAEDMFRRSSKHKSSQSHREFQFATIAKDFCAQHDIAHITEPMSVITGIERCISKMYADGVGADDDPVRLERSLRTATVSLSEAWKAAVESKPPPEGEVSTSIGPSPDSHPLQIAAYVSALMLRIHHNQFIDDMHNQRNTPVPAVLFDWLSSNEDPYSAQLELVVHKGPTPACHDLFWQTVRICLLRGNLHAASDLLTTAGFDKVRSHPGGDFLYTGQALENVERFTIAFTELLQQCPAMENDWDILNSNWTLFRIQARGFMDRLKLFAEGGDLRVTSDYDIPGSQPSMSRMARQAASQLPWDIYENLQTIYMIVLGDSETIIETAQDWFEATIGLCGWWDDSNDDQQPARSLRLSHSQALIRAPSPSGPGTRKQYLDRTAAALHLTIQCNLSPNPMNPVEVALASCLEGNVNAVIGMLRVWSLPIACAVAEIASLGGWLPPPEAPATTLPLDDLDADDMALLGISQPNQEDTEGIKDTTLVLYARELAGVEKVTPEIEGWEMAIEVLGRMDGAEKTEDMVRELLRGLLDRLDPESGATVDKIWRILNILGMQGFAEETAQSFADLLSKDSMRFGEALWYYALAHRADKVRDVLNLLMALSLLESTAYPQEKDLDQFLRDLLSRRRETLEQRAKQDLEAAQLLGRMLSGYATLRKFYEIRDAQDMGAISSYQAQDVKRKAAFALVAVISSADDNIRGGLYDANSDAVVSEEFLLALLGEASIFLNHSPPLVTSDQINILLKAVEDIQTVGSRILAPCEEMFNKTLSAAQGLKGSTPADLLTQSTTSLSGSSYVMTGSSMLTSHMHKSISGKGRKARGWDWRKSFTASTVAEDVLRKLRLGLAKDLASLWLLEADGSDPF